MTTPDGEQTGETYSGADRHRLSPEDFAKTITEEERALIIMRDELYESDWEKMKRDLRNRLTGKPYIFKLVNRIEADLESISGLQKYEAERAVNLRRLLDEE
ncbi:MAG: hypothetical protein JXR97_15170 [Planctomycetes bacterium]|nr:hypothetical protein [Planctomycetota bacterium]